MSNNYRITSADFVTPGESLEPDAFISAEDLAKIKTQTELRGFLHKQIADRISNPSKEESAVTIVLGNNQTT
jgi:hypothetical protein